MVGRSFSRLSAIFGEQGKMVLSILHDMDFVAENFERVIVMAHGKVLADGTKEMIFAQSKCLRKQRRPAYLTAVQ